MKSSDEIKKAMLHCSPVSCRSNDCPYEDDTPKYEGPEELKDVLVYRDGCFAIAHIITGDYWTYCGMGGDPTHWMPLPEPPMEAVP